MLYDNCNGKQILNAEDASLSIRAIMELGDELDCEREHFWVMGLNPDKRIIYIEFVSTGTMDSALVDPREVFRCAIIKHVDSIIIAHNHPGNTTKPSDEDVSITENLKKGSKILNIVITDHIILTKNDKYSFRERGLL